MDVVWAVTGLCDSIEGRGMGARLRLIANIGLPGIHVDDPSGIPEVFQFGFGNRFLTIRFRILTEFSGCCSVLPGGSDRLFFNRLPAAAFAGIHIDRHETGLLKLVD